MGIRDRVNNFIKDKTAEKNSKEPERNPFFMTDYCIIKDKVKHQGIGGKKAYFDRPNISLGELIKQYCSGNIAVKNFVERRQDLFKSFNISDCNHRILANTISLPDAKSKKFHYVKIWNTNDGIYPEYCYLGYVICSDEIKKAYKVNK